MEAAKQAETVTGQQHGPTPQEVSEFTKMLAQPARVFSLVPKNLTEAMEYAKILAASEIVPKQYKGKPGDILVAMQMGAEFGIPPIQSLHCIAVINGTPSMWGDMVLALVRRSGLLEYIKEREPVEALEMKEGRCEVKRKGAPEPRVVRFTLAMADKAGLTGKSGTPWQTYPGRMLQMRPRAWCLRDEFGDVLKGLQIREEVEDFQELMEKPTTLGMPERKSAGSLTSEVDAFLRPNQPPRQRESNGAQQQQPQGEAWTGHVESVEDKAGKTPTKNEETGKVTTVEWIRYTVKSTQGEEFYTFDKAIADTAKSSREGGIEIELTWTPEKHGKRIESIREIVGA